MMAASFVMVVWNLQDSSLDNANTGSRYATIESLVDYGTYWIDQSRYVGTIDKYQADGHYISSKPPMLPTLGAGVTQERMARPPTSTVHAPHWARPQPKWVPVRPRSLRST